MAENIAHLCQAHASSRGLWHPSRATSSCLAWRGVATCRSLAEMCALDKFGNSRQDLFASPLWRACLLACMHAIRKGWFSSLQCCRFVRHVLQRARGRQEWSFSAVILSHGRSLADRTQGVLGLSKHQTIVALQKAS